MRRVVIISVLTLIIGFGAGLVARLYLFPVVDTVPIRSTMSTVAATTSPTQSTAAIAMTAAEEIQALDRTDNLLLLEVSTQVLLALEEGEYATLSALVHPEKGVTFTPYSTVQPDVDLCFTSAQIALAETDSTPYVWGVEDGTGFPIELTMMDYIQKFVYNTDFSQASQIGIDTILSSGNAMENVVAIFPQGRFVEYHISQIDPELQGYDWCSLKLVFEIYENEWMLVGLIHSQWTI